MTVQECINRIGVLKPHQFDNATLLEWLSAVEQRIYDEIVSRHEGADSIYHGPYTADDMTTALMIPGGYADVYLYYLQAQIDYYNGEMGRFNNSMTMYNVTIAGYADWYNRENAPLSETVTTSLDGVL